MAGLGEATRRLFHANKVLTEGMAEAVWGGYEVFAEGVAAGDATNAMMAGWLVAADRSAAAFEGALKALVESGGGSGSAGPSGTKQKKPKPPKNTTGE